MARKKYEIINGGETYRLVIPAEARQLLDCGTKVYSIHNGEKERLQLSCDVDIFLERGINRFYIEVGEMSEMILNME